MADVMMKLGSYAFGIDTAAYQQLQRATRYRWAAQSRVGAHDALQFTGYGEDTITLTGYVYPGWRGGLNQIRDMRERAAEGEPMLLVDGNGFVHGQWVVVSIEETAEVFAASGTPRKQQFILQMRLFDDGPQVSNS